MTVAALRERIAAEATANLMPVLIDRMSRHHEKGWRDCDCQWCGLKREATGVIGTTPLNVYGHEAREERRERLRQIYRARMRDAYG